MSLYVTICHYMSLYVTTCHFMSLIVTLCHFMSLYVTLCHVMSLYVTLCHLVRFHYAQKVAKIGKKWQKVAKSSKKWQKVECHQFQNSFYKLFNVFSGISEPPEEPRHLKVLEATSSTARLSWERPKGLQTNNEDDQLPIKSFTIEWTPIQGKPMQCLHLFLPKVQIF